MKYISLLLVIFIYSVNSFGSYEIYKDTTLLEFTEKKGLTKEDLEVLVTSITTSDLDLFPGVGQVILVTQRNQESIKGLLLKSPEYDEKLIYLSLEEINKGKEIDLLSAKKYGVRLPVLKVELLNSKLVSSTSGGVIKLKILKNGFFKSYHKFKMKLDLFQGEWKGLVKLRRKYTHFQSMFLKASKVGVKKVEFK
jgi:hypothetical protein